MTSQERYKRFEAQPDYLKTYVQGISEACYYHVIMQSKNFAILQRDGFSWYKGPYGGNIQYAPVKYVLISKKTRNIWYEKAKELDVKGRLNPMKRNELQQYLTRAEKTISLDTRQFSWYNCIERIIHEKISTKFFKIHNWSSNHTFIYFWHDSNGSSRISFSFCC